MILKKKRVLRSSLSKEEIISVLKSHSQPCETFNITEYKFEGRVTDNGTFKILPLFDYHNGSLIRPSITGVILENSSECEIELIFDIESQMKNILFGIIIINIILSYFIYLKNLLQPWALPLAIAIFCFFAFAMYLGKVQQNLKVLNILLR